MPKRLIITILITQKHTEHTINSQNICVYRMLLTHVTYILHTTYGTLKTYITYTIHIYASYNI